MTSIHDLRCEYRLDPLGIDAAIPRLSWLIEANRRGEVQIAFQVLVASTAELLADDVGDLWDSGCVSSDTSIQVEYAGRPLASRQRCCWKVRIWDRDNRPTSWSAPACWSMGLLQPSDWSARWIGMDAEDVPGTSPVPRQLRRTFAISTPMLRATVYATALGLYELRLNGARVGDHLLAPEWTNYERRVQYQTHDVTALLQSGDNCLGALLGNGWYCGNWQFWQSPQKPIYGTQPRLLVQLEIEYVDGSRQTVASDEAWSGTTAGPLRFSGIYEGETYDARRALPGWDRPGFDDHNWRGTSVLSQTVGQLVWQRSEPIAVTQELTPQAISEPRLGVYVFDLGQNIAGWCRLRLRAPAGTELTMRHNEVLNPDGTVYMDNLHAGHISQGDRQIVRYTCRGDGEEVYEPAFTYLGFRYIEVEGLPAPPDPGLLTGRVFHTGFRQTGAFTCSEPLVDRLVLNGQWSQRANMMGVPTDCCQRDERCGYTGDMNFFMPTATYYFDIAAFVSKWLVDVCQDSQLAEGTFADHAPYYGPGPGPNVGWSDAGIICPYLAWRAYGDTRVIREHYAAMRRKLAALERSSTGLLHTAPIGNGDWLNLGGGAAGEVIGTAYDAYDFRLMAEMAQAIGEDDDAAAFAQRARLIAEAFVTAYVDGDGRIANSSQTGYALSFTMDLVPERLRQAMAQRFADEIARFGGHLATGFIGTPRLLPGLHAAGLDDLAYGLLLQREFPSWLFQVRHGATSMWERWDGWHPQRGFADSGMNSFNHYAFGSVGEYLFSVVGGITAAAPGFKHIRIQPEVRAGLDWADATFDSIHGRIRSAWRREAGKLHLSVTIPANTRAVVVIPASARTAVRESGRPLEMAEGVSAVRSSPLGVEVEIGAGTYAFSVV